MKNALFGIFKIWLVGILGAAAVGGHVFYWLLSGIRIMQTHIKLALALVVSAALLLGIFVFLIFAPSGTQAKISIPRGATLQKTARILEKKGVIRNRAAFILLMKLSRREKKIRAGIHEFSAHDNVLAVSRKLMSSQEEDVRITITEGLTIAQVALRFKEALSIDTATFLELCRNDSVVHSITTEAPTLEGYLFPDTYRFAKRADARDVVAKMTRRFVQMYAEIEIVPEIDSEYSQHDIVTLASIVEKEATVDSERPLIAGVFHNRLELGYPLGADPTVRYAINKFTGPLRVSELNVNSPYNTRKFKGLPPGPICNPGFASLKSAASPRETDYLYFVAKWDGSGEHEFAKSNREHVRNKLRIRRKRNIWKKK